MYQTRTLQPVTEVVTKKLCTPSSRPSAATLARGKGYGRSHSKEGRTDGLGVSHCCSIGSANFIAGVSLPPSCVAVPAAPREGPVLRGHRNPASFRCTEFATLKTAS